MQRFHGELELCAIACRWYNGPGFTTTKRGSEDSVPARGRRLPETLEKRRVDRWLALLDFFVRVAHGSSTTLEEFTASVEALEQILLDSLYRRSVRRPLRHRCHLGRGVARCLDRQPLIERCRKSRRVTRNTNTLIA